MCAPFPECLYNSCTEQNVHLYLGFTDVQAECGTNFTAATNQYCDYLPLDQCVSGFPGVSTTQAPLTPTTQTPTTTTQVLLTVPTTLGPRESKFIYPTPKKKKTQKSLTSLNKIDFKKSPLNAIRKNMLWWFSFHSTGNFKINNFHLR